MPWALQEAASFGDQQGGVHAVLVPHKGAGQDSRSSPQSRRGRCGSPVSWNCWIFSPMNLKPVSVSNMRHAVVLADARRASSVETMDFTAAPFAGSVPCALRRGEDVVQQHAADLVAGQQLELARPCRARPRPDGRSPGRCRRSRPRPPHRPASMASVKAAGSSGLGTFSGGEIGVGQLLLLAPRTRG